MRAAPSAMITDLPLPTNLELPLSVDPYHYASLYSGGVGLRLVSIKPLKDQNEHKVAIESTKIPCFIHRLPDYNAVSYEWVGLRQDAEENLSYWDLRLGANGGSLYCRCASGNIKGGFGSMPSVSIRKTLR